MLLANFPILTPPAPTAKIDWGAPVEQAPLCSTPRYRMTAPSAAAPAKIFKIAIGDGLRKDNPADYETRIEPKMGKAPKRGQLRGHHKAMSYQDVPACSTCRSTTSSA